jgi:hypothetical protein
MQTEIKGKIKNKNKSTSYTLNKQLRHHQQPSVSNNQCFALLATNAHLSSGNTSKVPLVLTYPNF